MSYDAGTVCNAASTQHHPAPPNGSGILLYPVEKQIMNIQNLTATSSTPNVNPASQHQNASGSNGPAITHSHGWTSVSGVLMQQHHGSLANLYSIWGVAIGSHFVEMTEASSNRFVERGLDQQTGIGQPVTVDAAPNPVDTTKTQAFININGAHLTLDTAAFEQQAYMQTHANSFMNFIRHYQTNQPHQPPSAIANTQSTSTRTTTGSILPGDLPLEIITDTAKLLPLEDKKNLRLVNRTLFRVGGSAIKQHLKIRNINTPADLNALNRTLTTTWSPINKISLAGNSLTDAGLAALVRVLRNYPQVTELDLSDCPDITDAGLLHLQSLPHLTHLNLSGCHHITDTGLGNLSSLVQLTHLNLSNCNDITNDGLPRLHRLTQLTHLNLSNCNGITNNGLNNLHPLAQLTYLNLSSCHNITNSGLGNLHPLAQLTYLNLSNCQNIGNGLQYLQSLTGLTHLTLSNCTRITNDDLRDLQPLNQLVHLNLRNCQNLTNVGVGHLRPMTQLMHLNLADCQKITNVGVQILQALTNLEYLNLSRCKLTDAGFRHFRPSNDGMQPFAKLKELELRGCNSITKTEHFQHLTMLERLNFADCKKFSDIQSLRYLPRLKSLNLAMCPQLDPAGLHGPRIFPELTDLNLGYCNLINAHFTGLTNLGTLQCLDLAHAQIPEGHMQGISGLTNLTDLNLMHLRTSNTGLNHLGTLSNMKRLNLAFAKSDGVTPAGLSFLQYMTKLTSLNLSFFEEGTATDLQHLPRLGHMKHLDLTGWSNLTDSAVQQYVSPLQTLISLKVNECDSIGSGSVRYFSGLPNLNDLEARACNFGEFDINTLKRSIPNVTLRRYD